MYNKYTSFGNEEKIQYIKRVGVWLQLIFTADALGLTLVWTCFSGSQMVLQIIFGMVGTSV